MVGRSRLWASFFLTTTMQCHEVRKMLKGVQKKRPKNCSHVSLLLSNNEEKGDFRVQSRGSTIWGGRGEGKQPSLPRAYFFPLFLLFI